MDERRRARRIRLKRDCVVVTTEDSFDAQLMDISTIGALIETEHRPDIGEEVSVRHQGIGELRGRVIRHTDDGFGIYFELSTDTALYALKAITLDFA